MNNTIDYFAKNYEKRVDGEIPYTYYTYERKNKLTGTHSY
jgi:hypothetical protein